MQAARRKLPALAAVALLAAAALLGRPPAAPALEPPPLKGRVNDYAGLLSPAVRQQLEAALRDFEQAESTQIVLLTIPSLEGDSLEAYSIRVAEAWKIGRKGLDNGAILLVAKAERKIRIEVGYGLEGRLTDLQAGRIIRNVIVPEFRAGRFDEGIAAGVQAMMAAVKGEFQAPERPPTSRRNRPGAGGALFVPLIVFALLVGRLGAVHRLLGGVAGAVLAPLLGLVLFGAGLLLSLLLVPAGFLAGLFLSLLLGRGGGRMGGFYGGFGGGGFSSGGFGGGGFSGGGGGFGGGGASGSW